MMGREARMMRVRDQDALKAMPNDTAKVTRN